MKVLIIGGVSYDHIIHCEEFPDFTAESFFANNAYYAVGGTGAGKALNLSQLGFEICFQYRLGDDEAGRKIADYLNRFSIQSIVDHDQASTECHTNLMNSTGQRLSIYTNYPTFDPEVSPETITPFAAEADAVVVNIINYCRHYLPTIKRLRKPIWVDIHDYDGVNAYHQDFIEAADFLFFSAQNIPNYRRFMLEQINQGKTLVVCTLGKDGALCLTQEGHWYEQPIISQFQAIDTNGAGDAFMSGFMFGFLNQKPIQQCMEFGSIAGGLAVTSTELFHPDLSPDTLLSMSVP